MSLSKHQNVKTVFLDIDDTLWENNIFFLESLAWLCKKGREHGHTDRATTSLLNFQENFNIQHKGYGYDSYESSLMATVRSLVARSGKFHVHSALQRGVANRCKFLRCHPIAWCCGVSETLPVLTERFRTIVVTKGHQGDQMAKVERCGLKDLFHSAEVVPHKYPDCYKGLLKKYALKAEETVMIGNSPRSDINMAKKAGLRTVYVPHLQTWYREMEPISTDGPLTIHVRNFSGVLDVLED